MNNKMKRNSYYDKIKGLAIVFVVIGHSIQWAYPDDFDAHEVFRLIYSFHMPLFMFMSGVIAYRENKQYCIGWLKKRFDSLIVPFLVWTLLPCIFLQNWKGGFLKFYDMAKDPGSGYWFLWTLFQNSILLVIVYALEDSYALCGGRNVNKNETAEKFQIVIATIICLILLFITSKYKGNMLGIRLLSWYWIIYYLGFLVGKHKMYIKKYRYVLGSVATVIWIVTVPYWRRGQDPIILSSALDRFEFGHFVICRLYNYLVAFTGIGMIFLLVLLLQNFKISMILEKLGQRTIEIYLMHYFFLNLKSFNNNVISVFVNLFFGLVAPYVISEIFEKKFERSLLFGK